MPKIWKTIVMAIAMATSVLASAKKPSTIPLDCGNISGFNSEAERVYMDKASGGGDIYLVNITYIGKRPSASKINLALRQCLALAAKKDGSKDIVANAWYRSLAASDPSDDEMLNPYGALKFISYTAAT